MLFQLPNGKTVHLTLDEYLNLTDDEINFLVAYGYGQVLNNPRHGSVLGKLCKEDIDIEDLDEESEDYLDHLSEEERVEDLDSPIDMD